MSPERVCPMSNFDRNYAATSRFRTDRGVAVDAGLRAHMIRVYNYMAGGVALTGVVAWLTFQMSVVTNDAGTIVGLTQLSAAMFGSPLKWVVVLGPLALVFFMSFRIGSMQASTARTLFFVYAGALGL